MTKICACAICAKILYEGDKLADLKVFKCGELSYIALAHESCAKEANDKAGQKIWEIG